MFGCGAGNYHVLIMFDPNDADETARALAVNDRMVRRSIELQGTCTGEHGVGAGKLVSANIHPCNSLQALGV